ncbi:MAG TPA: TIGR03013 family XrtA/PEP-CTERM system glycosyltransferase, partial [Minicystis sp.]|nr:TIGR03013 family XrtA/PEP-CTERM system glycosyltransferase [Minicystis sp.]
SLYFHGLYGPRPVPAGVRFVTFVRALALAALVVVLASWWLPAPHAAPAASLAALGAAALVLPAWRTAFDALSNADAMRRPALVLGTGRLARACTDLITGEHDTGLRLVGAVIRRGDTSSGAFVVGHYEDIARVVAQHDVRHIVVASQDRRGALPMETLLELKFRGVEIEEGVAFYERVTGKLFVRELKPSQLIFSDGFRVRPSTLAAKRAFDVACAVVGLVLAAPLMLLTAIAIRLDSSGPVLYSQLRAGAFGEPFLVHKFRSMRVDAEANGAQWAAEDDPRVTRVGRFIRKTRIDELPQLWNVLVGEMSMVGPRPERPVFIAELEKQIPFFRQRLCVKPGVTGHAQVRCKYGASTEDALEKLQYDLYYIKSFSLWFDLSILLDTVKVVLLRIGAR